MKFGLWPLSFAFEPSFSLLSKSVQIKIHRAIIVSIVFCWCVNLSVMLREEYRMRVFEGASEDICN
jgi:steroid 5-alpha reductase family enzyme